MFNHKPFAKNLEKLARMIKKTSVPHFSPMNLSTRTIGRPPHNMSAACTCMFPLTPIEKSEKDINSRAWCDFVLGVREGLQ